MARADFKRKRKCRNLGEFRDGNLTGAAIAVEEHTIALKNERHHEAGRLSNRRKLDALLKDPDWLAGEVSAYAPWERVISRRYVLAGGETRLFGALGGPGTKYWPKPLQREVDRPMCELKQDSQNGNSGSAC